MKRTSAKSGDSATATGSHESMERTKTKKSAMEAKVPREYAAAAATWVWFYDKKGLSGSTERELAARVLAKYPERQYQPPNSDALNLKPPPKPIAEAISMNTFFNDDDDAGLVEVAKECRESRKLEAARFTTQYKYDKYIGEQRYCVSIDNAFSWPAAEKSSGIKWVGVRGEKSICVVTRRGDLDKGRLHGNLKVLSVDMVLSIFRKSIICEMEDLEDPSSGLSQKFQKCVKKPFAVVSVIPDTNNVKASDYTIQYLKEKMKRDTDFDGNETIKTAIHAFIHLFPKLKLHEIEVSVADPRWICLDDGQEKDSDVLELPLGDILKYL